MTATDQISLTPSLSRAVTGPTLQRTERRYWIYLTLIVAVAGCVILVSGAARHYLSYGTEVDTVDHFAPDAQRFLQGRPMECAFHPPFYSIALGATYLITRDWLKAGLVISWISGIVVLVSSFLLFRTLCSRAAALGALLGLLASGIFLLNWGLATSDMFFLAEVMLSCLLALQAFRSDSTGHWMACGVAVGLAIVTRTNGLSLAVLALAPLFGPGLTRTRLRSVAAVVVGMAIPLAAIALFGRATGSNVIPRETYLNLAVTYFGGGRHDFEAGQQVSRRFTGMRSVLLHHVATIAKDYITDLYRVLTMGITKLVELPLYYAFLPGLLLLAGLHLTPVFLALALVPLLQLLLVNFTYFEPRLYLFLVPWLGAAVGEVFRWIYGVPWPRQLRRWVVPVLAGMWLVAVVQALGTAGYVLWHGEEELSEVIPLARSRIQPGAVLLASKPNLAFYIGATKQALPELPGLPQLHAYTLAQHAVRGIYIFYGFVERSRGPQYAALARGTPPSWLEVAGRSRTPGGWVLLHVR